MNSQFKYAINYVAAWPSVATEALLYSHGIRRRVHLTTFFDGFGQMASVKPYPWTGPQSARIAAVVEWKVGNDTHLIAELDDCSWSHAINAFYRDQGVREDNPHKPHLALDKRVAAGTAEKYQALVGQYLFFDRHGGQVDDRAPFTAEGDMMLRDWKFERHDEDTIKVTSPPRGSGIPVETWAWRFDARAGFYELAEALMSAPRVARSVERVGISPAAGDFKVDTFRPGGGGGWIQRPDSCVRVTHVPTGLFEESTEERSQHANKAAAMKKLLAKLESSSYAKLLTAQKVGPNEFPIIHITDLANLPEADVAEFAASVPTLIAMMKVTQKACEAEGLNIRVAMPVVRFVADQRDTATLVANQVPHEFEGQALKEAAQRSE